MTRCPICGTEAVELDRTGHAEGYDCARHGKFKVAHTVLSTKQGMVRAQWERALEKARSRTTADQWPTIITSDF
jgi:hypothetical protein